MPGGTFQDPVPPSGRRFSVETAGTFDLDAELDLWFSGLGKVRLEFRGNSDVRRLSQMIAAFVL